MSKELQELYTEFHKLYTYFRPIPGGLCPINHIDDWVELTGWIDGTTMLMVACYYNDTELVKKCISLGANINKRNITGRSALSFAIINHNSNCKIVELLLSLGADPNIKVRHIYNHTIFIPLIFYQIMNITTTELLVRYGATINEFHKYRNGLYRDLNDDLRENVYLYFIKLLAKRRWVIIKCIVLTLSIHKRAVERVYHPDRLKLLGTFEEL